MKLDLNNRHVIITGGTGALGTSTVEAFLNAGAKVSVPCLNRQEHETFTFKEHPSVHTHSDVDLTSEKATQQFYRIAVDSQGSLWASIHIAGGFAMGSVEDTDLKAFTSQLQLNTITCYNTCRAAVQWMHQSDWQGGRIVNVASKPAVEPRLGKEMTAYTVSKAGVAALTQSLAAEVAGQEILVNAIAPSIIDTPANRSAMSDADYTKWPKPDEIASQILYLTSPQNTVTRGAIIPVYGKS